MEPRMTSRVDSRDARARGSRCSIPASRSRAASAPFSRIGWWTVVSGGSTCAARSMSSKPTMLRSPRHEHAELAGGAHRADRHRVAHREDARGSMARGPGPPEGVGAAVDRGAAGDDPRRLAARPTRRRTPRDSRAAGAAVTPSSSSLPESAEPSGPSTARTTTSRWPRASRCSAAARAPPSSSTTTELWLGQVVGVDEHHRQAGGLDLADLGMVCREADRDHAIHGRAPHGQRQRAMERRDEVELVAELAPPSARRPR